MPSVPRAQQPRSPASAGKKRRPLPWTRLSDEALLRLRFCDLGIKLARTPLARRLQRLNNELSRRGIDFHPHAWLAEEWFSPDGVPGIAVPFYLAHPRLERLERTMMKAVEGGNAKWQMRILRHEAGHALDTAFRLRRRRRWREVFGPASLPYPDRYRARPGSRRYVHHLGDWYAQAHPTEDFAETFAVWLTPNSGWRRSYAEWPAYGKLALVDELMGELRGKRPAVRSRARIESLDGNRRTLGDHYREKLARHSRLRRGMTDDLLKKVFAAERPRRGAARAGTLLRAGKREVVDAVVRDLDLPRYSVVQIMRRMIERSEQLRLYARGGRRESLRNARWALARLAQLYSAGESPQLTL